MTTRISLAFTLVALTASMAHAQATAPRGFVTINAGLQSPSRTFSDSFTFETYVEDATVGAEYEVKSAPFFDGGFSVRLFGPVGAGVAVSRFSHTGTAKVTGTIPHPFYFEQGRDISGDASVKRNETAVHAQLAAFLPVGRVLVVLTAGPSFLTVEQGVVTGVAYDESYPFDEATLRRATVRLEREKKVGFNAGADVTVMLGRSVGVGGMIRYAATTVDLTLDGRTLSLEAGSLQAGGGIRFVF